MMAEDEPGALRKLRNPRPHPRLNNRDHHKHRPHPHPNNRDHHQRRPHPKLRRKERKCWTTPSV